jgi:hypothetical protein
MDLPGDMAAGLFRDLEAGVTQLETSGTIGPGETIDWATDRGNIYVTYKLGDAYDEVTIVDTLDNGMKLQDLQKRLSRISRAA